MKSQGEPIGLPYCDFDPDADIEFLSATVGQIEQDFRQRDEAGRERLIAQMSMNIILSDPLEIEADDPGKP